METAVPEKLEARIILAARIVLGLVFLFASLYKLADPESFARATANYRLLPSGLVNLFAVVVPWLELVCGLMLLLGQWVRTGSFVITSLLALFVAAVAVSMMRGLDIHCGCFSPGSGRQVGLRLLAEDAVYLVVSVFLVFRARDQAGWGGFLGSHSKVTTVTPSPPSSRLPAR